MPYIRYKDQPALRPSGLRPSKREMGNPSCANPPCVRTGRSGAISAPPALFVAKTIDELPSTDGCVTVFVSPNVSLKYEKNWPAKVAAIIKFAGQCEPARGQLPFSVPAIGIAAATRPPRKRRLVRCRNISSQHNGGAVPMFKTEDELSGRNIRRMIQFPLRNDASLHFRLAAVRPLPFTVAELVRKIGRARLLAAGRQNHRNFRHQLEATEIMRVSKTHLRRALQGITKSQPEPGSFQHRRQGGRNERCPVLAKQRRNGIFVVQLVIDSPIRHADRRHRRTNR